MRLSLSTMPWAAALLLPGIVGATIYDSQFYTPNSALFSQNPFSIYGPRPDDCPPCFNCNLGDFRCQQFGNCSKSSGKCSCPPGFGGEDCSQPLCGSLADGNDRAPRDGATPCECKSGWEGINCNVCKTDTACSALMPGDNQEGGVCYREGIVVKENHQICDITNRMILEQLKGQKPQATFSCNAEQASCNFQFWVDQKESFYCALDKCDWGIDITETRNTTSYKCKDVRCECVPGRMLCGAEGSVDIGDFLTEDITGPAEFSTIRTEGGSKEDGSRFSEPAMNQLIADVFGDESIFLNCHSGECVYKTEVPAMSGRSRRSTRR